MEILDFYHACEHLAAVAAAAFRARQFPSGSGAIESAAKNLVQARLVQAGMRWSTPGAQRLADLRALHRSGRWAAFWHSRPRKPWARAAPATRAAQPHFAPAAPAPAAPAPPASRPRASPGPVATLPHQP